MRLKVQLVSERATCLSRMYTSKSDSCGMLGNSVPDRRLLRQSWPDLDRPPACLTPHARNSATSVSTATAEKCQTCHRVLAICYLLLSIPIPVHTTTIVLCINADLVTTETLFSAELVQLAQLVQPVQPVQPWSICQYEVLHR